VASGKVVGCTGGAVAAGGPAQTRAPVWGIVGPPLRVSAGAVASKGTGNHQAGVLCGAAKSGGDATTVGQSRPRLLVAAPAPQAGSGGIVAAAAAPGAAAVAPKNVVGGMAVGHEPSVPAAPRRPPRRGRTPPPTPVATAALPGARRPSGRGGNRWRPGGDGVGAGGGG